MVGHLVKMRNARAVLPWVAVAVAGFAASACQAPTYGTDKTATSQLAEDVSGILSLGPKKRTPIDYKPRPDLVKPSSTDVLPPPQQNVASSGSPEWPESPEQRLARIRNDATLNQNNALYQSPVEDDLPSVASKRQELGRSDRLDESGYEPPKDNRRQREEFNRRLALMKQGDPNKRRYLSDPPLTYRQPAADAPTDDIGEDEAKKERARRAAAQKKGGGFSLGDLWPF